MPLRFIKPAKQDTYVNSATPTTSYYNSVNLLIGSLGIPSPVTIYRSFLQFDLDSLPIEAEISEARLRLYIFRNDHPGIGYSYRTYQILRSWTEDAATWNNQPMVATTSTSSFLIDNQIATYIYWDLLPLVNKWQTGEFVNFGIALKEDTENGSTTVGFYSSAQSISDLWPALEIVYRIGTVIISRQFYDQPFAGIVTTDNFNPVATWDVSIYSSVTYFILNQGNKPAEVFLEVSPNSINWVADSSIYTVAPQQLIALTPKNMARWGRIKQKSKLSGKSTTLDIWVQSQG